MLRERWAEWIYIQLRTAFHLFPPAGAERNSRVPALRARPAGPTAETRRNGARLRQAGSPGRGQPNSRKPPRARLCAAARALSRFPVPGRLRNELAVSEELYVVQLTKSHSGQGLNNPVGRGWYRSRRLIDPSNLLHLEPTQRCAPRPNPPQDLIPTATWAGI